MLDLIDMEERRNRQRGDADLAGSFTARQVARPRFCLSMILVWWIMTRQACEAIAWSERYVRLPALSGAGLVKSSQTVCYEILGTGPPVWRARAKAKVRGRPCCASIPKWPKPLRGSERDVLNEIEDYIGSLDINSDPLIFQEQFDFAFV